MATAAGSISLEANPNFALAVDAVKAFLGDESEFTPAHVRLAVKRV